jgi:hypothetical protein
MFTENLEKDCSGEGLAADFGNKFTLDCSNEVWATELIGLMDKAVCDGLVGSLISITSKS